MSKYVKKPHGLIIGSDNLFSYRDEEGKMHHFPALVGVHRLYFDNYSTLHAGIRSTAEQLLFTPVVIEKEMGGFSYEATAYRLKSYWLRWLDENCPGWGYPPLNDTDLPSLFFAKRKHALAFANHVADVLKGERYL